MCSCTTDSVLSHICIVAWDLVGRKLTDILGATPTTTCSKGVYNPHAPAPAYSGFREVHVEQPWERGSPACSVVAAISGPSSVVEHRGDCTHLQSAADVLQHLQNLLGVICPHPVHQAIDCCGTVRGTVAQAVRGNLLWAVGVALRGT